MADTLPDSTSPGVPLAGPLYKDVKRQMMALLTRGEWRPGEAIPAERRLSEQFGISIGTVRKAIDELVAENILIRQQGRGTFVASHNRDRLLFYFFHVVAEEGPKEYPEVRLLQFGRGKADRVAADRLGLQPGDPVFRIRNLLRLGGAPVILDDIALSAARFSGLAEKQFRDRPSTIYNLYQDAFGISVVRIRERLRATEADAETAALLGLPKGAPLLQIRRVALTYNDAPVEYRVSLVDTTRHEYWNELANA
ncbi:MAG: GntR family transcriptional regulator [Betaproteobacteria bacterium]